MAELDVVVVASGEGPGLTVPSARHVVAADGGLHRARALGLDVEVVVGDLDSVTPEALAAAEAAGARVVRYPRAKDATDLELALDEGPPGRRSGPPGGARPGKKPRHKRD